LTRRPHRRVDTALAAVRTEKGALDRPEVDDGVVYHRSDFYSNLKSKVGNILDVRSVGNKTKDKGPGYVRGHGYQVIWVKLH
jgi:hypothetical protein